MDFVVRGLSAEPFQHLYGLPEDELVLHGAKRYVCDESPGFPDRIELRDAEIGETLLLVNHVSMNKDSPYRASHAIFIREGATFPNESKNTIPNVLFSRFLSLRAFDVDGMILSSALAKGTEIESQVLAMFSDSEVLHIDAHSAERGCFQARFTRT